MRHQDKKTLIHEARNHKKLLCKSLLLQVMIKNLISSNQNKYFAAEVQAKMQYYILNLENFYRLETIIKLITCGFHFIQ